MQASRGIGHYFVHFVNPAVNIAHHVVGNIDVGPDGADVIKPSFYTVALSPPPHLHS